MLIVLFVVLVLPMSFVVGVVGVDSSVVCLCCVGRVCVTTVVCCRGVVDIAGIVDIAGVIGGFAVVAPFLMCWYCCCCCQVR